MQLFPSSSTKSSSLPHAPRGQGLVEYGLILTLVALAAIIAVTLFGQTIQDTFRDVVGSGEYAPPDIGPIGGQFTQRPPTVTPSSTPSPIPTNTNEPPPPPPGSTDTPVPSATPTETLTPSVTPTPTEPPCPYGPYAIPGRVEMENYTCGGQNVAYSDTDVANLGGAYRTNEGVDVQSGSGISNGHNVGWTQPGEWMRYRVNIAQTGVYRFDLRFASTDANGQFRLFIDGQEIPQGLQSLWNTNGWESWQTYSVYPVALSQGVRTIEFRVVRRTMNLDYFEFSLVQNTPTPTPSLTPTPSITPTPIPRILYVARTAVNNADFAIITRLQSQGYTVDLVDDRNVVTADANGKVLVIVSSTVDAGNVGSKFRTVAVPVLTWESGIYATMRMAATNTGTSPSDDQIRINSANLSHPLAAGLSGNSLNNLTVTTVNSNFNRGDAAANAIVIASSRPSDSRPAIFGFNQGVTMNEGLVAPARRVGFFFGDSSAEFANANAWALFDAAVTWARGN